MQALQSAAWAAGDPITVNDAIEFITGRVHGNGLAWRGYRADTRTRVSQLVRIGLSSKREDVRLEANGNGRLAFATLMQWIHAIPKLRETQRNDGTRVFAGLPSVEDGGAARAMPHARQTAAYAQPAESAQLRAALEEALLENVHLQLEVARLQAEIS